MPTSEAPAKVNEPTQSDSPTGDQAREPAATGSVLGLNPVAGANGSAHQTQDQQSPQQLAEPRETPKLAIGGSRWIDYDTHELLEMISELEDERRWSRLREGVLWAVLLHIILLSFLTWIPKYVFKVPKVDVFDVLKDRQEQTYLDLPPDALRQLQKPKVVPKPLPQNKPLIDKQTMEELKRQAEQAQPIPPVQQQTPEQLQPQPAEPIPNNPQSQAPEAPRPQAVPARPNFAMGSKNPADQLRQDMLNAMHGHGQEGFGNQPPGIMQQHPGAGAGGVQILSDTQGIDFNSWLQRWYYITERTWDPLIPDEVNPPISKQGVVQIRFKVLPNGQVTDMVLEGRSGDTGLDRAAWGALTGSSYPPLPHDFHGPYLELRAAFLYNVQPQ